MRISGKDYLSQIEEAKCCRPHNHSDAYGDCYDEEGGKDWHECEQEGYRIAGFYRGSCNGYECMEWLKCCKIQMKTGKFSTQQLCTDIPKGKV